MARYDYRCPACHHVFEVEHGMNEKPKVVCPVCGTEASRVFEATGITLKGSGFYNTDMRGSQGSQSSSAPHTPSDQASTHESSEGGATEGSPSSSESTPKGESSVNAASHPSDSPAS